MWVYVCARTTLALRCAHVTLGVFFFFACLYIYITCTFLVLTEARKKIESSGTGVLGIDTGSYIRAATLLTISLSPSLFFQIKVFLKID